METVRNFFKPLMAVLVGILTPRAEFIVIVSFLLLMDFILHTAVNFKGKRYLSEFSDALETSFLRFIKQVFIYSIVLISSTAFSKFDGFGWSEHAIYTAVAFMLLTSITTKASKVLGDVDLTKIITDIISKKSD